MDAHASTATKLSVFVVALALTWAVAKIGLERIREARLPVGYGLAANVARPADPAGPLPSAPAVDGPSPTSSAGPKASSPAERPTPYVPRVHLATQFDGSPFQNANCTLAAGAMLVESAFGIQTTGSVLRRNQGDQEGGTDLVDLQSAVKRALRKDIVWKKIRPDELRALLTAGAGVVVQGDYELIPLDWRLQRSFDGDHAIYIDFYYPGDPKTPPSYYVIDPLGRGKYAGQLWDISVVDAFAAKFAGRGRVLAAWVPP